MKKCLSFIFAALLTASALTGCAGRNSLSEQDNAAVQSSKPAAGQPAAPVSTNVSAAYETLTAYKTGDYRQRSIADFNAALASTPDELTVFLADIADVINAISPADENYDFFTTTMSFSAHELYCEHMGEEFAFSIDLSKQSKLCDYLDEDGEPVYEFNCFVASNVPYSINNPKLVAVAERDKAFLTFKEEMQNYLNGLSEEEIAGANIKKMLTEKSAEIANRLSTENMKLSPCEIYMLDVIGEAEKVK